MEGCVELRTSEGRVVWGPEHQAVHGECVLACVPWQCGTQQGEEVAARALRRCCLSEAMGHPLADNIWDTAVLALQRATRS